jgi:hydrophobic/amphiphilic exporter-1 (mainly G- bacteria), HAE1 family
VMMTSFAFIFGLFPLVVAVGAGALTRHAVGTPVFGGMIAASVFGIFLIPLPYITAEHSREWPGKAASGLRILAERLRARGYFSPRAGKETAPPKRG